MLTAKNSSETKKKTSKTVILLSVAVRQRDKTLNRGGGTLLSFFSMDWPPRLLQCTCGGDSSSRWCNCNRRHDSSSHVRFPRWFYLGHKRGNTASTANWMNLGGQTVALDPSAACNQARRAFLSLYLVLLAAMGAKAQRRLHQARVEVVLRGSDRGHQGRPGGFRWCCTLYQRARSLEACDAGWADCFTGPCSAQRLH